MDMSFASNPLVSCLLQVVWRIPEKLRRELAMLGSFQP